MLRRILQRSMTVLAVTFAAWTGSGWSTDLVSDYSPLDEGTMGSARGSNPAYTSGFNLDCADYSKAAGTNEIGSIACASRDQGGTYINYRSPCVNCSATIAAWPSGIKVTPPSNNPLQTSTNPNQMNQNCGTKTVGMCDLSGMCSNAGPVVGEPTCATITPNVPQPTTPTNPNNISRGT